MVVEVSVRVHLYPSKCRMFLPVSPTTTSMLHATSKSIHQKEGESEPAANGTKYIMDDTQASINAGNSNFKETSSTAWDDSYQLIINPKQKCTVEYNSLEPWPIGHYSIYLYIPESKGGIDAEVQVRADNTVLHTYSGEDTVRMHIPTGGSWVLVGQYMTDRYYERPVKLRVNITVPENQTGEYPIDAIAFVHQPFTD